MRRILLMVAALCVFAPSGAATAAVVVKRDVEGRSIYLDVRSPNVDVEWYAKLLRTAAHGPEISSATVRIVAWDAIARECGADAVACYSARPGQRSLIVVPAGKGRTVAHALFHEYAHHLDWQTDVTGLPEPNGTPAWAIARDIPRRYRAGEVRSTYAKGWEHAVGEIFAEDYAQLHLRTSFDISWLPAPDAAVLDALRADLPGAPAAPLDLESQPFVAVHAGTLRRGKPFEVPFALLGPGRRLTFTVRVARPWRAGTRAWVVLRCGRRTVSRAVRQGRGSLELDLRGLGPGSCTIRVRGVGSTPLRFWAVLRLAVEADGRATA